MREIKEVLIFVLFLLAVVGCAAHDGVITESDETKSLYAELDAQIYSLSQQLIKGIKNTGYEGSKIIIISGSLMEGTRYSVLEDYIIKSLKRRLCQEGIQRDTGWSHSYELPFVRIVEPCREDWIPLKEGDPPLSLSEAERFVVLETSLEPYKDMNKIIASVSAYTFFHGKQEPLQINGALEMDFSPCSLPNRLYQSDAPLPLPSGTEEKPYLSLEDLAYGLVSEVLADYPKAQTVGVVDIKADPEMNRKLVRFLREAIEDYLIKNGLRIGVSRVDFGEVIRQYIFYHKHMIFDIDELDPNKFPFSPATIYLFIDTRPGLGEELTIRTSLKALWLGTSDAGIYVRGLMGIAYAVPPVPMASELWGQAITNTQEVDKKKLVNQATENLKNRIIDYIRSNRINTDLGIIQKEVDAFVHRPGLIKTYTIRDRKFQNVKVIKGVSKGKVFCHFIWPLRRTVAVNYKENIDPDISLDHLNNKVCSRVQDILGRWGFDIKNSDSQINLDIILRVRRVPSSLYSNRLDFRLSLALHAKDSVTGSEIASINEPYQVKCFPQSVGEDIRHIVVKAAKEGTNRLAEKILQRTQCHYFVHIFEDMAPEQQTRLEAFFSTQEDLDYHFVCQDDGYSRVETFSQGEHVSPDILEGIELKRQSGNMYVYTCSQY